MRIASRSARHRLSVRSTILEGPSAITPAFQNAFSSQDIRDIIEYLHTLKPSNDSETTNSHLIANYKCRLNWDRATDLAGKQIRLDFSYPCASASTKMSG